MSTRKGSYDDDCPVIAAQTVHEEERETFTGLYNAHGQPLHRQRQPVGFDPHRWDTKRKGKSRG